MTCHFSHFTGKALHSFALLLPQKKPREQFRIFMKCFVCPDIFTEWTHTEGSSSECQNIPSVLDHIDMLTQQCFIGEHYFLPNEKGNTVY